MVREQFEPDGTFPTVSFPNPEEPGAMDLLLAVAAESGALAAIANDPDADRLGAAIPQPDGSWRRLGGDELGWLLAEHILDRTSGDDRLVVTTLVSSSLLERMAAEHGVQYAETFTGFKWIGRTVLDHPNARFVFGYEQALGYLVTHQPLDKDGITAAIMFAEVAATAAADGATLQDRLDAIAERYGRHVMAEQSDADGTGAWRRRRSRCCGRRHQPRSPAGGSSRSSTFPEANLLRLMLDGGVRVQIRPSGTEPKVKLYGEAVGEDPAPYVTALAALPHMTPRPRRSHHTLTRFWSTRAMNVLLAEDDRSVRESLVRAPSRSRGTRSPPSRMEPRPSLTSPNRRLTCCCSTCRCPSSMVSRCAGCCDRRRTGFRS